MQKFISKYVLTAHLAFLAVAPLFLFPYCNSVTISTALLWLSLMSAIWLFLEPSRRNDETLHAARKRVLKSIISDPLAWTFVLILAYGAISCFNGNIELLYDFTVSKWGLSSPKVNFLPSSATGAGYAAFSTLIAVFVSIISCRHALGRSARLMYAFMVAFLAGIAAIASIVSIYTGNESLKTLVLCELTDGSFAGSAYGLFFITSLAALSGLHDRKWNRALVFFAFAVGATFSGLVYFAPMPVIAFYSVIGAAVLVFSVAYVAITVSINAAFKYIAALILASSIPLLVFMFVADDSIKEFKVAIFDSPLFSQAYYESKQIYTNIASSHWGASNTWLGSGLGSFPLILQYSLPQEQWAQWSCNGWWQVLVERGMIGAAVMVIPFIFLAYSFISRVVVASMNRSFLPLCLLGLIAPLVMIVEGFYNSSLLRPEMLIGAYAFFALGASSFPVPRKVAANETK